MAVHPTQPPPDAPARTRENRLARQTSPYLLQHAHNPVDWYPWGPEAFEAARQRDVPIFLSIGYSTCYWCHVMERESFESETVARVLNDHFVPVKVDREERPDVDDLYMNAVQAFTGHGGWPMSVFLEPRTLRPFYGGTYYPPEPHHGLPSFTQVLEGLSRAWREQRAEVDAQAEALAGAVAENLARRQEPRAVGREQVAQAVTTLLRIHDRVWGGFGGGDQGRAGGGPKFPQPVYLDLLLGFRAVAADVPTREAVDSAVRLTLDKMALGGLNDQAGGGFHRYSVDGRWLVPHFEKMLYDNGQLAETYARAARVYDDPFYRRVVRRTLDYVLREMTSPEGAFYSAQDAEVAGHEGQNYLWTREQLTPVLGEADAAFAARVYGLDTGPNFKDPHHPDEPASNVLWMQDRPAAMAQRLNLSEADFLARLDSINTRLYDARAQRPQPRLDDKVLTAWNGMIIAGLAAGGDVLGEPRFINAAGRAADFVLTRMRDGQGGLLRSFRAGEARIPGFLDDYAWMIHGLIELHRAGRDEGGRYLDAAEALADEAERRFTDPDTGAYFDTLADQSDLFVRARSTYDGAIPSAMSVMLHNLIDLFEIRADRPRLDRAVRGLRAVSAAVAESPVASINSTRALLRLLTSQAGGPALSAALAGAAGPNATGPRRAPDDVVQVFASEERLLVGEGHENAAAMLLQLRIAEAYHITAADPGPGGKDLIPLRVFIVNGGGVAAHADYPSGEAYGPDGELRIHRGIVEVPVVIERTGDWSGRPLLAVRYQACTDTECLAPTTVELDVAIDRK